MKHASSKIYSKQKRVGASTHLHILFGRKKSMEEDEDLACTYI
jgi:hypothetical protein